MPLGVMVLMLAFETMLTVFRINRSTGTTFSENKRYRTKQRRVYLPEGLILYSIIQYNYSLNTEQYYCEHLNLASIT